MKRNLRTAAVLLLAALGLFYACGTTNSGRANTNVNREIASEGTLDMQINSSLADVLRKNSSLQVVGSGDDIRVYVRGVSTFNLNTQPLYVINDMPIGNSYASANNAVNPNDIYRVRVLRSAAETMTIWGERGSHGVILIETKSSRNK